MGDKKVITYHNRIKEDDARFLPDFKTYRQYSHFTLKDVTYQLGDFVELNEKKQISVPGGKSGIVQIVRIIDVVKDGLVIPLWFTLAKYAPKNADLVHGMPKLDPEREVFWDKRNEVANKMCYIKNIDRKINVLKIDEYLNPAKEKAQLKADFIYRFALVAKRGREFFMRALIPKSSVQKSEEQAGQNSQSKKPATVSRLGQFQHETQFNDIMDEPSPSESVKLTPRKRQPPPSANGHNASKNAERIQPPEQSSPFHEWTTQDLTRSPEKSPVCMRFTRNKVATKQVVKSKKNANKEDVIMVDSAEFVFDTPTDLPFPKRAPRKKLMERAIPSTSQTDDSDFLDEMIDNQPKNDSKLKEKRQKKIDKFAKLALRNPQNCHEDTSALEESDIRNKVAAKQVVKNKKNANKEDVIMVDTAEHVFDTPTDLPFPKRAPRKKLMERAIPSTSQADDSPFLDEMIDNQPKDDSILKEKRQKKIDKFVKLALRNPQNCHEDTSALEESDIEGGKPILSLNMPKFVTQIVNNAQKKTFVKSQQTPEKLTKKSKPVLIPHRLKSQVQVDDGVNLEVEDEAAPKNLNSPKKMTKKSKTVLHRLNSQPQADDDFYSEVEDVAPTNIEPPKKLTKRSKPVIISNRLKSQPQVDDDSNSEAEDEDVVPTNLHSPKRSKQVLIPYRLKSQAQADEDINSEVEDDVAPINLDDNDEFSTDFMDDVKQPKKSPQKSLFLEVTRPMPQPKLLKKFSKFEDTEDSESGETDNNETNLLHERLSRLTTRSETSFAAAQLGLRELESGRNRAMSPVVVLTPLSKKQIMNRNLSQSSQESDEVISLQKSSNETAQVSCDEDLNTRENSPMQSSSEETASALMTSRNDGVKTRRSVLGINLLKSGEGNSKKSGSENVTQNLPSHREVESEASSSKTITNSLTSQNVGVKTRKSVLGTDLQKSREGNSEISPAQNLPSLESTSELEASSSEKLPRNEGIKTRRYVCGKNANKEENEKTSACENISQNLPSHEIVEESSSDELIEKTPPSSPVRPTRYHKSPAKTSPHKRRLFCNDEEPVAGGSGLNQTSLNNPQDKFEPFNNAASIDHDEQTTSDSDSDSCNLFPSSVRSMLRSTPVKVDPPVASTQDLLDMLSESPTKVVPDSSAENVVMKLFEKNRKLLTTPSPGNIHENPFVDPLDDLFSQRKKSHSPGRIIVEGSRRKRKSVASSTASNASSEIETSPDKSFVSEDEMEAGDDSSELSETQIEKKKVNKNLFQQKFKKKSLKSSQLSGKSGQENNIFNLKQFIQTEVVNEEFRITRNSTQRSSSPDLLENGVVEKTGSEPCNEVLEENLAPKIIFSSSSESQYFSACSNNSPEKSEKSCETGASQNGSCQLLRNMQLRGLRSSPHSSDTQFYSPLNTPPLAESSPSADTSPNKSSPSKPTSKTNSPEKLVTPRSSPRKVTSDEQNSPSTNTRTRSSLNTPNSSPCKNSSKTIETENNSPKKITTPIKSPKTLQVAVSPRKSSRVVSEPVAKISPQKSMSSSNESIIIPIPSTSQPLSGQGLRDFMKLRLKQIPESFFLSQDAKSSEKEESASQLNDEEYAEFLFTAKPGTVKKFPRKIKDVTSDMQLPSTSKSPVKRSRVSNIQVEENLISTSDSESSPSLREKQMFNKNSPSRRKQQIVAREEPPSPVKTNTSPVKPKRAKITLVDPVTIKFKRQCPNDLLNKKRNVLGTILSSAKAKIAKKMSAGFMDVNVRENLQIGCLKSPINRIQTPPPVSSDSDDMLKTKMSKIKQYNKRVKGESGSGESPSPKRQHLHSKKSSSDNNCSTDGEEYLRSPTSRRGSAKHADTSCSPIVIDADPIDPNKSKSLKKKSKLNKSSVAECLSELDDESDSEEEKNRSKPTPVKATTTKRSKKGESESFGMDILTSPPKQNASQLTPRRQPRRQSSCEPSTSQSEVHLTPQSKKFVKEEVTPKSKKSVKEAVTPDILTPKRRGRPCKASPVIKSTPVKGTPTRKQSSLTGTPTRKQPTVSQSNTPKRKHRGANEEVSKQKKKRKTETKGVQVEVQELPGREREMQNIKSFALRKFEERSGGCMYISGVPGTGKTASVNQVILMLQDHVNDGDLPNFKLVQVSGMELVQPQQIYSKMVQELFNIRMTHAASQAKLDSYFKSKDAKRPPTLLIIDELDMVCTRRQDVVYSIFDWTTLPTARLSVLAIANTMDLPERVLKAKVASRLGLTRLVFRPYTFEQLKQIVMVKLPHIADMFDPDALALIVRKVASVSGDARRTMDLCRRASELVGENGVITLPLVTQALEEMTSSPTIQAVRSCSNLDRLFLRSLLSEIRRTGLEESTLKDVFLVMKESAAFQGYTGPRCFSQVCESVSRLSSIRLILISEVETGTHALRVSLNVSSDELHYALA